MPCENCNCGRKSKEIKETVTTILETSSLTCEEEYQEWLERAERLGIRLITDEEEGLYEHND